MQAISCWQDFEVDWPVYKSAGLLLMFIMKANLS